MLTDVGPIEITMPRDRDDSISTITDKTLEGMAEWQSRPLDPVDPVVFLDAIHVKIRDGAVASRPIYAARGVKLGDRLRRLPRRCHCLRRCRTIEGRPP